MPTWETIKEFIEDLGWTKGMFTIFFFIAHYYLRSLYLRNIKDKQGEIDRISNSNKELRAETKSLRDELREAYRRLAEK